jgi:hypothetical protein
MADEALKVILEAEDEVTPIVGKANSALDNFEKKATDSHNKVIRITDQTRTSVQRLIASVENQAEVYGKAGVEKLITQRDQLLQRYSREPAAIDAITRSYQKMIETEQKAAQAQAGRATAQATAGWVSDPLGSLRAGATSALTALGAVGGAIAGAVVGMGSLAAAGYELVKSYGAWGTQMRDVELRMGMSAKEISEFDYAAKAVGKDISVFEAGMRGLTAAVEDNSAAGEKGRMWLGRFGVDLQGLRDGTADTAETLEKISAGLNALPSTFERNHAGMEIFKRSWFEMAPAILEASEHLRTAKEHSWWAPSEAEIAAAAGYTASIAKIEESLGRIKTIGEGVLLTGLLGPGAGMSGPAKSERETWTSGWIWQKEAEPKIPFYGPGREDVARAQAAMDAEQDAAVRAHVSHLNEQRKEAAEKAKHDAEELKQFEREAAEFDKKGNEAELDAIQKIIFERDHLLQQARLVKASEADINGIFVSAARQIGKASQEEMAKFGEWAVKEGVEPGKAISALYALPTDQQKANEKAITQAERDLNTLGKARLGYQEEMIRLQSGPGGELETARQIAALRIQSADTQVEKQVAVLDYLKQEAQIQAAMDKKAQEEMDRQEQSISGPASGLFHTLLTRPQDFGRQLGSTVHQALIKPISEGLGGMVGGLVRPLVYGADGSGGIAGLFGGMFSGKQGDPVKVSTDQNTTATMQNSAAILLLTAHLAAGMGMGTPTMPSVSGIAGASIPSISMPSVGGGIPSVSSSITYGSPASFGLGGGSVNPMAMGGPGGGDILTNSWTRYMMGTTFGGNRAGGSSAGVASLFSRAGLSGMGAKFGIGQGTGAAQSVGLYGDRIAQGGVTTASSLLTSQGAASLYMAAGLPLGMAGLTGSRRGTWGGVAESTAGGALAGAGIGTMLAPGIGTAIGAGIGAAAGFGASVGEMLFGVKSLQQTAHDDVQKIYGVSIPVNSGTIKQIVGIATSQFGGSVSVAVRSPSVRQLVLLYSEASGQKMPLSATTPYGGSLVEQGGQVYQQASYQDGQAHLYASSLPTLGNIPGSTYPTPGGPNTSGGAGPISVALNINGTPITPGFVSDSYSEAQGASINRVQQAATLNVPGLMVA